jgi:hypothetical protein
MRVLAVLLATALVSSAIAEDEGKPVRGKALQESFADHEYGDGTHFAYRFRADGTFSGTELGKDTQGRWRMRGPQMCWRWTRPPGAEECYDARRNGEEISLYRNDVEQWLGTLKAIEADKP